jgi:hypothetical protein
MRLIRLLEVEPLDVVEEPSELGSPGSLGDVTLDTGPPYMLNDLNGINREFDEEPC